MLRTILMILHFFCAFGIVALVLLQRGKGAEAGAGFGAGASGTVFGARGAGTALSRATYILAALFLLTSLSLSHVVARKATPTSILDQLSQPGGAKTAPADSSAAPSAVPAPAAPAAGAAQGATPSTGGTASTGTAAAPTQQPAPAPAK